MLYCKISPKFRIQKCVRNFHPPTAPALLVMVFPYVLYAKPYYVFFCTQQSFMQSLFILPANVHSKQSQHPHERLRQVESYLKNMGMPGLASARAMARRRPIWRMRAWRAWRLPGRWPDGGRRSTVARRTRQRAASAYVPITDLNIPVLRSWDNCSFVKNFKNTK